jgi:hypothetical protein
MSRQGQFVRRTAAALLASGLIVSLLPDLATGQNLSLKMQPGWSELLLNQDGSINWVAYAEVASGPTCKRAVLDACCYHARVVYTSGPTCKCPMLYMRS